MLLYLTFHHKDHFNKDILAVLHEGIEEIIERQFISKISWSSDQCIEEAVEFEKDVKIQQRSVKQDALDSIATKSSLQRRYVSAECSLGAFLENEVCIVVFERRRLGFSS